MALLRKPSPMVRTGRSEAAPELTLPPPYRPMYAARACQATPTDGQVSWRFRDFRSATGTAYTGSAPQHTHPTVRNNLLADPSGLLQLAEDP